MKLFNELPLNDINTIESYAKRFSWSNFTIGIENFLHEWDKEKRKLYKLLGNKFIHEFTFVPTQVVNEEFEEEVYELTKSFFFRRIKDIIENKYLFSTNKKKQGFWENIRYNFLLSHRFKEAIIANTLEENLNDTLILYDEDNPKKKLITISPKMKPIKAIKKIVDYLNDEDLEKSFEDFRLLHSMILNKKPSKEETICISIHPMDYMTMSDNDNNWSSCMSWKENGCYRTGTLEMLNSNNTLVVYVKSNNRYTKIMRGTTWNSKSWRMLTIFTKHVIITGKQYPNYCDERVAAVLEELKKLAKENLGWDYEGDVVGYNVNKNRKYTLTTGFMYNDFLYSNYYEHYFMVERDVFNKKRYRFSYSGKVYCLECGERMFYDDEYRDLEHSFRCYSCIEKTKIIKCPNCNYTAPENNFIVLDNDKEIKDKICRDCFYKVIPSYATDEEFLPKDNVSVRFFPTKDIIDKFSDTSEPSGYYDNLRIPTKDYTILKEKGIVRERLDELYITIPVSSLKDCKRVLKKALSE